MSVTMRSRLLVGAATIGLVLAACSGSGGSGGSGQTINIAVNPWVGYEANAGVIATLIRDQLGDKVEYKELAEQVSWEGIDSGTVDAILENWGHADLAKTYITDKKVAEDAGSTGVDGIIGWYVPPWMAQKYPDITDWNNLNKYADMFKTSESGDKGQHRLEQPEQIRRHVQDVGVGRQGPAARWRSLVRDERRGDHQRPQSELQGRLRGQ
jgi:glycine betaine/proline transport system substrate-binding protein